MPLLSAADWPPAAPLETSTGSERSATAKARGSEVADGMRGRITE
jgi:hypothetical protein